MSVDKEGLKALVGEYAADGLNTPAIAQKTPVGTFNDALPPYEVHKELKRKIREIMASIMPTDWPRKIDALEDLAITAKSYTLLSAVQAVKGEYKK